MSTMNHLLPQFVIIVYLHGNHHTMRKIKTTYILATALVFSWALSVIRLVIDIKTPEFVAEGIELYDLQFNYIFTYLFF